MMARQARVTVANHARVRGSRKVRMLKREAARICEAPETGKTRAALSLAMRAMHKMPAMEPRAIRSPRRTMVEIAAGGRVCRKRSKARQGHCEAYKARRKTSG